MSQTPQDPKETLTRNLIAEMLASAGTLIETAFLTSVQIGFDDWAAHIKPMHDAVREYVAKTTGWGDPVFQSDEDGKWYFWNETWTDTHGPFHAEADARKAVSDYAESL